MRVSTPHFMFLVFRQSKNAQCKNLVNFGCIEEVSWALGSNLGVVIQNDRRRQDRFAPALFAGQYRPSADIAARGNKFLQRGRRIEKRNEFATFDCEDGVR